MILVRIIQRYLGLVEANHKIKGIGTIIGLNLTIWVLVIGIGRFWIDAEVLGSNIGLI